MFAIFNFSPYWWNKNYGIEFTREFYQNQVLRVKTIGRMEKILGERFPRLKELWEKTSFFDNPCVEPYGHRFGPALFGCNIRYKNDQTPWSENNILSENDIMEMPLMTMDEFKENEVVKFAFEQAESLKKVLGKCPYVQGVGGIANTVIYLRGMKLFTDFYDNPEMVRKLYSIVTNAIVLANDYYQELDGTIHGRILGNCSVSMLSPAIYREFNYHYDRVIMEKARTDRATFNIHQDSNVTPFIEVYKLFDYLHSFDVGGDTDIGKFRDGFPDVTLNIWVYNSFLYKSSIDEIYAEIKRMKKEGGPEDKLGFSFSDIDDHTSDEKINALYDAIFNC